MSHLVDVDAVNVDCDLEHKTFAKQMSTVSSGQVFRFNLQGSFFCEVLSEQDSFKYAVMMPERFHLFPFRTQ